SMGFLRQLASILFAATAVTGLLPASACAQAQFHLVGARVEGVSGAEFKLGYQLNFLDTLFVVPALGGFSHQDPNSQYAYETQRNGTEVCRDHSNGQYASKSQCDSTATEAFLSMEAGLRLSDSGSIGLGVRVADNSMPYVAVRIGARRGLSFQANA